MGFRCHFEFYLSYFKDCVLILETVPHGFLRKRLWEVSTDYVQNTNFKTKRKRRVSLFQL